MNRADKYVEIGNELGHQSDWVDQRMKQGLERE